MTFASLRLRQLTCSTFVLASLAIAPQLSAETPFTVPPGRAADPIAITVGPDHNLWFTENGGLKIGRITTAGVLAEFSITGAQGLCGIAVGPDGNIWFTDEFAGMIGHINTSGTGLITYSLAGQHPQGIAAGPDGKLWFVNNYVSPQNPAGGFRVASITITGTITQYLTHVNPGVFAPENFSFAQITKGSDGNLWFTNSQTSQVGQSIVGKITTGGVVTIYSTADTPVAITSGPDGNLWVTEYGNVAKITTSGVETPYPLTTGGGGPGITTGPDGNLWFDEVGSVGFVTPGGAVTEFPAANYSSAFLYMSGIASGSDGALWVLGSFFPTIGRVSTTGQLTNSYPLNVGSMMSDNTLGPDGAIWATGWIADAITRIDTQGNIHTYPTPSGGRPSFITSGPDGNLWFTEPGRNSIAVMTTAGSVTGEYSVGTRFAGLWSIVKGPDGNLWFPEYSPRYNNIVRITPAGVKTPYAIPTPSAYALYLTNGPDGNLWFTESSGNKVAKINPSNGQITEYPFTGTSPEAIVTGPDGNLWIMDGTAYGAIAKFSTSGILLAEYPVQFETLLDIKVGSDGALWIPQYYPNGVARITTSGVVSTVPLVTANAVANDLAFGSDQKIWITEGTAGVMGRMSAIGGTGNTIHATHGVPFNGAVASFVDGTPTATAADFTATINWGDGTQSSGTVSGSTGGPFTVTGTHTYGFAWNYFTVVVTLHDTVDNATYTASPGLGQVN